MYQFRPLVIDTLDDVKLNWRDGRRIANILLTILRGAYITPATNFMDNEETEGLRVGIRRIGYYTPMSELTTHGRKAIPRRLKRCECCFIDYRGFGTSKYCVICKIPSERKGRILMIQRHGENYWRDRE